MQKALKRQPQRCAQVCAAGAAAAAGLCSGLHRSAAFGAPSSSRTVPATPSARLHAGSGGPGVRRGARPEASRAGLGRAGRSEGRRRGSSLGRHALPEPLLAAQAMLEQAPQYIESYGAMGPVLFFGVFVLAECLSLPGSPLLLSSGYLFGLQLGCAISLLALSTAAIISFLLARTVLRPQLIQIAEENETFQNINCAVQAEGFKIVFLLRLAPLLPFALSNYAYGLSSVGFLDFLLATVLGCAPGTCAFVYLATAARSLGSDGPGSPWYVYAGGILATGAILKIVTDVAQQAIRESTSQEECSLIEVEQAA
mmetsp:Transcript_105121/g.307209  ORF Transcript_105121/g.307209 Transcript_105121/m.307209 type:complete len:312 (+) Transcript_105121:53-988(+)